MTNSKKYSLLLTFALLLATLTVSSVYMAAPATAQTTSSADWPMFRHDAAGTGFNPSSSGPNPMKLAWDYKTGGNVHSSAAIVAGKVYIGSDDEYLYCLDGETGSLNWRYKTAGAVRSSPAVVGGKVYFGSYDYCVYCLDASSGSLIWKYTTKYFVAGSPCVVDDKVFITSNDNRIYCLNAATGTQVWNFSTRTTTLLTSYWNCQPAVVNGKVYFGSTDRYLYCLNENTGAKLWEYQDEFAPASGTIGGSTGFRESSPCVVGGAVYIGGYSTRWCKVNATTGKQIWAWRYNEAILVAAPSDNILQNSAAYAYDTVYYIYSNPHMACAVDPATGLVKGMFMMGQMCRSSISIAHHKAYCGNNDRFFYVGNADNMNTRLESISFPQIIESSPTIADDKVYIGDADMHVRCYEQGVTQAINGLQIDPSPRTLPLGSAITVTGGINAYHGLGPEGQTMTFTYVRPDGTSLNRTSTSGLAGVFSDIYTPDAEGGWKVRAWWAGNPWWLPSTSYYQTFTVTAAVAKPSTTISASVSNATITTGDSVTVSGVISPTVTDVTVTLTYTKPDATSLTRTSVSGGGGVYSDTYTPDTEGSWSVTASWAGSDAYTGATSSSAAFTVSAAGGQTTGGAAIPMEIIYAVVAIIVIAIVAILGYWYMKRPKK